MRKRDRSSEEKHWDAIVKSGLMRLGENPSQSDPPSSPGHEVAQPHRPTNPFPYYLAWDRLGRKGQKFRVINPKPKAKLVKAEFEDGFIATIDRRAIRRSD